MSTDRSGWLPPGAGRHGFEKIRTVHASFRLTCPPVPWRSGRLTRNGERSPDPRERPARRGWRRRTGSRRRSTNVVRSGRRPPAEAGHDRELRAGDRLHGQPAAFPGHHHVFEAGGLLQRFERYYRGEPLDELQVDGVPDRLRRGAGRIVGLVTAFPGKGIRITGARDPGPDQSHRKGRRSTHKRGQQISFLHLVAHEVARLASCARLPIPSGSSRARSSMV